MIKQKLQDFQDHLSNKDKPAISLRKAANTPGYYQNHHNGGDVNTTTHEKQKKAVPQAIQSAPHEKGPQKSSRRQSEGVSNKLISDKENAKVPRANELPDVQADKAKLANGRNKPEEEAPVLGKNRSQEERLEPRQSEMNEASDDEATIVNPVKNLIFDRKEPVASTSPRNDERLATGSSVRDNVSGSTKTVLKPIGNCMIIQQNQDLGSMGLSQKYDSNRSNGGSSRGIEYMNENNTLVKRVSREINNEIKKIKRTLSSASKSPGRNIYDNTPEKGKESPPNSAKKLMEFSGSKKIRINIDLEKVDGPFNNRTASLIPIQDFSRGEKKEIPYYSFHEESLLKGDDSTRREYPGLASEDSQGIVSQSFSPKVDGLSPKFYHNFVSKKVTSEKSFGQVKRESTNSNTYGSGPANSNTIASASSADGQTAGSLPKTQGLASELEAMNTRDYKAQESRPSFNHKSKHSKQDIYDFYIDLLRKIELIKFTVNFTNMTGNDEEREFLDEALKTDKKKNAAFTVEIDNIKLNDELDNECYRVLCARYGKEYFILLKKIFNMYSVEKKETRVLGVRQLIKIAKDFRFNERIPGCSRTDLELIFTKRVPSKYANFQDFIEILFKVNKLNSKCSSDSEATFKGFLDEFMVQRFKELSIKVYEYNLDRIQVFYQSYNPYENPSVCLLYECDNLTKHLFSIYESIDIKRSTNSFITQKSFIKFCNDYGIIPLLCNNTQISKIFRIFQKGNQEIIGFTGFVMLLCCVAHIGLAAHGDKYKGFYKKIYKLFELLMQVNNHISDTLVISNLKKSKD